MTYQNGVLVGEKIPSDFAKRLVKPTSITFRDLIGAFCVLLRITPVRRLPNRLPTVSMASQVSGAVPWLDSIKDRNDKVGSNIFDGAQKRHKVDEALAELGRRLAL